MKSDRCPAGLDPREWWTFLALVEHHKARAMRRTTMPLRRLLTERAP